MTNYRHLLTKKNPTGEEIGLALVNESCLSLMARAGQFKQSEIDALILKLDQDSPEKTMVNFYLGAASAAGRVRANAIRICEELQEFSLKLSLMCAMNREALIAEAKSERFQSWLQFLKSKPKKISEAQDYIGDMVAGQMYQSAFPGKSSPFDAFVLIKSMRRRVGSVIVANSFLKVLSRSLARPNDLYTAFETPVPDNLFNVDYSVFCERSIFKDVRDAVDPLFRKETVLNGLHFDEDGEYSGLEWIRLRAFRKRIELGVMIKDAQFSDQLWNEYIGYSSEIFDEPVFKDDLREALFS